MAPPRYPTREELAAGGEPIEAVPQSAVLRMLTTRAGHALDKACVYWTGFSIVSWEAARLRGIPYQPSLLLMSKGRKSGRMRACVLPYVRSGADYIVVGSNAGKARDPHWVNNLRADPSCRIRVRLRTCAARARIADGHERKTLMDAVAVTRPHVYNYDAHAGRHGRRLKLVVLTPSASAESSQ